ncbi:MAG TPA: YicC/YloC family endoribonuclease [Pirellulaceae bacterium]|nr:YicC/YloC family endoribonuclease [Pirellulaceae bacterium]
MVAANHVKEPSALLLSMTGHGEAHRHDPSLSVAIEIRTVNNRYFKLNIRTSEGYILLEPQIEAVVRQHVRRGTVQLNLQIGREPSADDYKLNEAVLRGYLMQLERLTGRSLADQPASLPPLLALPGVVHEPSAQLDVIESQWPVIESVLTAALERLAKMRAAEGAAMAADLSANAQTIAVELAAVERRAPEVVAAYRARLLERLQVLLADLGVQIQPADVVREVGVFAERTDISEEIVRLRSHLEQFAAVLASAESQGRKLDFVIQEMFRETNTIGSKANDAEIARHVIEMKSAIERMREMIQNVE